MTSDAFVAACRTALSVEFGIVAVMTLTIIVSATITRWRDAWFERQLSLGRAAMVRALASDTDGPGLELLRGLPRSAQLELVLEFGTSLAGRELARLAVVGRAMGVVSLAENLCRSRFWWRRLRGARLATALDHDAPPLRALLRDRSPAVRAQALVWAAGRTDQAAIDELVRHLADPERLCRFTVQDSLLRLGTPAAAAVARFLATSQGPGLEDALAVARGLAQPELLEPVIALASHESNEIHARAIAVLGVLGGDAAMRVLADRLSDPSDVVRAASARATGQLGYWQVANDVSRLLGDPSWLVRREAAFALRRMGGVGLLSLRRALRNENPFAADMARQVLDLPDPVYARVAG